MKTLILVAAIAAMLAGCEDARNVVSDGGCALGRAHDTPDSYGPRARSLSPCAGGPRTSQRDTPRAPLTPGG